MFLLELFLTENGLENRPDQLKHPVLYTYKLKFHIPYLNCWHSVVKKSNTRESLPKNCTFLNLKHRNICNISAVSF